MNKPKIKNRIAIIVIVLIVLLPILYIQVNKLVYAQRVKEYLIEQKHYSEAEIASVKGVWGKKLPSFYVKVIFADEPYATYIYYAHRPVMQADVWPTGAENPRPAASPPLQHLEK